MPIQSKHNDPRIFQVFALSGLLFIGWHAFGFPLKPTQMFVIFTTALITQLITTRQQFDAWSASISALSLCLLLRTNDPIVAALAAATAIGSKHLIRFHGRHLFNPTAFALVVVTTLFDGAWISPGQWGHEMLLIVAIASVGMLVSTRASRIDISLAYCAGFALLVLARAVYLGDPLTIALHQLSNGALLIFAFFMLSDPRTTPARRGTRIVYALIVALAAALIEWGFYRPNGAIVALVLTTPLIPLLDHIWPAANYAWHPLSTAGNATGEIEGERHVCT